jgi:hypothetical protein
VRPAQRAQESAPATECCEHLRHHHPQRLEPQMRRLALVQAHERLDHCALPQAVHCKTVSDAVPPLLEQQHRPRPVVQLLPVSLGPQGCWDLPLQYCAPSQERYLSTTMRGAVALEAGLWVGRYKAVQT